MLRGELRKNRIKLLDNPAPQFNRAPVFRQHSRVSTPHHTSFCGSIFEKEAMRNSPHAMVFYEATHSSNMSHVIDHNLPHVGSWIGAQVLKWDFLRNAGDEYASRIASFTGYNPLSLDFFAGMPLISFGKYSGRNAEVYRSSSKKLINSATKHGSILKSNQRKTMMEAVKGKHRVEELLGDIRYEKVFEQEFSAALEMS